MDFRLIDAGWDSEFDACLQGDRSTLRIVCPFIKARAAERLLRHGKLGKLQVITRFNLNDFCDGVSDLSALRLLLGYGARIRGVRNLHAKLYLFGESRVRVTSANLTDRALTKNQEFGFVAGHPAIISRCNQNFDDLWAKAKHDLTAARLSDWELRITNYRAAGGPPRPAGRLGDEGVDVGVRAEPAALPALVEGAVQAFVKFFGEGHDRADRSMSVASAIERSGCHWACTYPRGKRPRSVKESALMFMGRLVHQPNDILIYGRAVAMQHQPGRDDASAEDLQRRPWKERWPHYIRVHHAEFIAGSLADGIPLGGLMNALGSDSFASVQRNAAAGNGNTDPRMAIRQQAAVELTPKAMLWLNRRLEAAFRQHGKLAPSDLAQLDWPKPPFFGRGSGR